MPYKPFPLKKKKYVPENITNQSQYIISHLQIITNIQRRKEEHQISTLQKHLQLITRKFVHDKKYLLSLNINNEMSNMHICPMKISIVKTIIFNI